MMRLLVGMCVGLFMGLAASALALDRQSVIGGPRPAPCAF
jgi:hypothetical protein